MVITDNIKGGINLHFCKNKEENNKITEACNDLWLNGVVDSIINISSESLLEKGGIEFINFVFCKGNTSIIITDYFLNNKSKVIKAFDDNKIAYNLIK